MPLPRRPVAAAAGVLAAVSLVFVAPRGPRDDERVPSGAYRALRFWGESRAYPERDIPRGAYTRAYEHARADLRRPPGERSRVSGPGDPLAPASFTAWQPIGPRNGGGRTLAVAFHPLDPGTLYAGAASGGLWRSTTGGVGPAAWERIDTGLPVLGVSSIEFEPGNPNVMYLGTGEVYNHQSAGNLAADRATRGSYGIGIVKSTDGGATWTKSLDWSYEQRRGVWAVRVDATNPSVVWAATTEGVYKSLDAGTSWSRVLDVPMVMDLVVHPTDPGRALAGCGNLSSAGRGIYRTTDGGASWTKVTGGGLPADFGGKIQLGVTAADPDLVFASVGNGFTSGDGFTWLLRSTDFGASFSLRSTTDYSRHQGWFAHDVDVSPADPDDVICVGIDVWKSVNGGANLAKKTSWWKYYVGDLPDGGPEGPDDYSHADHHDVVFHPTDPDVVYLGTDGGVFRSTDGGETFEAVNGGYQSTQFYNGSASSPTDPNHAIAGLQDNATAIYRGDGAWARWIYGGDGGWAAIDPTDPDVLFATAQELNVGRSDDGGATFTGAGPPVLGGPVAFIAPLLMSPTNPQVLYGGTSYFFRTTNGGSSWQVGNGGSPIDGNPILVLAAAEQNGDVVYLATAPFSGRGCVHRSLDGGATFVDVTGTLPDRYPGDLAVDPTDEATVYLTLSGFGSSHVFRSTDHGATWTDLDGGVLPDVPTSAVVVDPRYPDHVYVGSDLGVFVTADGGTHWFHLDEELSEAVMVTELGISAEDRRLRAFTHGRGVFERPLVGLQGFRRSSPPKDF